MQVKKEQLYTMATTLGIVKAAIKNVLPGYRPEVCDGIVFNKLNQAIAAKQAEQKGV